MAAVNPFHFLGAIRPNPSIRDFGRDTKFGHEGVWIKIKTVLEILDNTPSLDMKGFG